MGVPLGLWLLAWGGLTAMAPRLLDAAIARAERAGLGLGEVSHSGITVAPWLNGVTTSDLHAGFDLNPRDGVQLRSEVDAQQVEVRLDRPLALRGSLRIEGFEETQQREGMNPSPTIASP
jgi:hypothetical protein